MTTLDSVEDLRASRREALREPIPFAVDGKRFTLPPELPAEVLDPLFEGQLDGLIAALVDLVSEADVNDPSRTDLAPLLARLQSNPLVIKEALVAARAVFEKLLGPEQWPEWLALRPSFGDYIALAKFAWRHYGVSLGEALGLSSSSEGGGKTSRQTSLRKGSTRGGSGSRAITRR